VTPKPLESIAELSLLAAGSMAVLFALTRLPSVAPVVEEVEEALEEAGVATTRPAEEAIAEAEVDIVRFTKKHKFACNLADYNRWRRRRLR
jgi:hypothetical protein